MPIGIAFIGFDAITPGFLANARAPMSSALERIHEGGSHDDDCDRDKRAIARKPSPKPRDHRAQDHGAENACRAEWRDDEAATKNAVGFSFIGDHSIRVDGKPVPAVAVANAGTLVLVSSKVTIASLRRADTSTV